MKLITKMCHNCSISITPTKILYKLTTFTHESSNRLTSSPDASTCVWYLLIASYKMNFLWKPEVKKIVKKFPYFSKKYFLGWFFADPNTSSER